MMTVMNEFGGEQQTWWEEDQAELARIGALAGLEQNDRTALLTLGDSFKALLYLDCDIPQWAKDAYYNTLEKYVLNSWAIMFSNPTMLQIRGWPMIAEIVNNMVAVVNNEESGKNLLIYSAHDMTVAAMAFALGVGDQLPRNIEYGDVIMVDLVRNGSSEPKVEVIYMSKANMFPQMIPLNVPGCGTSCTLTTFRALTSHMMVDFDVLCNA